MGFKSTILVVQDVLKSRELYENILGCKVVDDFGIYNVGFEGGLALYKESLFSELIGVEKNIIRKANNLSVYFEFVHKRKEQPWGIS